MPGLSEVALEIGGCSRDPHLQSSLNVDLDKRSPFFLANKLPTSVFTGILDSRVSETSVLFHKPIREFLFLTCKVLELRFLCQKFEELNNHLSMRVSGKHIIKTATQ